MNKWLMYGALIIVGIVIAPRARQLPGIKMLPSL